MMAPVCVPTEPRRLKLTVTVHVCAGARLAPVQVFVPICVQAQIRPAPETATLVTATSDPPAAAVLVSVTVDDPVRVPDGKVIVSGFGEIDTVARAVTAVPVSVTGVGVTVAPV